MLSISIFVVIAGILQHRVDALVLQGFLNTVSFSIQRNHLEHAYCKARLVIFEQRIAFICGGFTSKEFLA